jgi:apolipoprotein N-acyltransferase
VPSITNDGRRFSLSLSLLGALLSGVLYSCTFPPARVPWLAWVALVPLLVVLRRARLGTALFSAWVFTIVSSYATGSWFPRAVSEYYAQGPLIGLAFFFGVATLMGGPGVLAFAAAYRAIGRRAPAAMPLLAAAAWVMGELIRARLLTGNPWILLGYSQLGVDPLVQIADLTGVYGVSFVLVAINAALAEGALDLTAGRGLTRATARGAALASAALVLCLAYGELRAPAPAAGASVTIGIVQGNVDLGTQWQEEFYGRNLDLYGRMTVQLLRALPIQLVFWPEAALTFFLDGDSAASYRASIASIIGFSGAQLVTGGPRVAAPAAREIYYNAAFLVSPAGAVLGHYDKQHLLPFAEYFPITSLDFLRRDFGRVREFTPGAASAPLPTVAGRAGVLICNEAMFPEIAAERVREGAQYLVNLANDSWLNDRTFSEITLNMVAFRAIEQRRYLVRASTSGPSAIVDPRGNVLARSQALSAATLSSAIAPHDGLTIYARLGDWFAFACAGLALTAVLWRIRGAGFA